MDFRSLRIASLNVQNFGSRSNEVPRCRAIARHWNLFDVIMIYEVMNNDAPLVLLAQHLSKVSGALWGVVFQSEYRQDARHVGFVFRRDRVPTPRRLEWRMTSSIRNHPLNQGRPKPYGLHRILIIQLGDLTLIGCHLKSLLDFRSGGLSAQQKRDLQIAMLTDWIREHRPKNVVLVGDFNSNDARTCAASQRPDIHACNHTTEPLYEFVTHLRSTNPTWQGSSRFAPTNLDHVFVSNHLVGNWELAVVQTGDVSDHNMLLLTPIESIRLSLIHRVFK